MAVIIEDTRQQVGKHGYFDDSDVSVQRCKLAVGDYCLPPKIAVDTKKGFEELVGNFCSGDRSRVKKEILKAHEIGTKLIFLVIHESATCIEDAKDWDNKRGKVTGETLFKTLDTFTKRYGVQFEFSTAQNAGEKILELLEVRRDE
jgi:ERCC4-type nuclease